MIIKNARYISLVMGYALSSWIVAAERHYRPILLRHEDVPLMIARDRILLEKSLQTMLARSPQSVPYIRYGDIVVSRYGTTHLYSPTMRNLFLQGINSKEMRQVFLPTQSNL